MTKTYYPLCADLTGRRCVVVGGGLIAQRKITTLLAYGAKVTVVSPTATRQLKRYARQGKIHYIPRRFRPANLRGAWLVYAATDERAINALVYRTAERLRIFTNVVDQKPLCSFIAPAIFKRGPLTIAVSTGGASPSLAKKLRQELGRRVGADYGSMLKLLSGLRGIAKQKLPSYRDRKRYFDRVVNSRVFALTRAGKPAAARRAALRLLDEQWLRG